ncbi:hypothetical protein ACFFRE_13850 [Aciditerrimonas ferrireducens]|uniref:Uncharacterized protein n=1 Tax=Aciditerrimonas ferrireducens TaxID=667306 RepID=A0ABV6C691_9ACTN
MEERIYLGVLAPKCQNLVRKLEERGNMREEREESSWNERISKLVVKKNERRGGYL